MKRAEQIAKREAILADWAACVLVEDIAEARDTSESNIYRIVRTYGEHITTRTERGVEMKRVEKYQGVIVKNYNEGGSIDQIAKSLGIHEREVRAAVYLAIQRGEIKAYQRSAP